MLSLDRCRKLLGEKSKTFDDNSLREMLSEVYLLGNILLDIANTKFVKWKKDGV